MTSHAEGLRLTRCLEKEPGCSAKLHNMNRNRIILDASSRIVILVCTLQSRVPPEAKPIVQMGVNDFKHIGKWTVDDDDSENQQNFEWLQREIQNIRRERYQPKRNILLITHHGQDDYYSGTLLIDAEKCKTQPWLSVQNWEHLQDQVLRTPTSVKCNISSQLKFISRMQRVISVHWTRKSQGYLSLENLSPGDCS